MQVTQLLSELSALRTAKCAAERSSMDLQNKLEALEEEKERAEMGQDMITRQTQQLLSDRQQLLRDLEGKDDAVRGLESQVDHLAHQLELALADREVLIGHLERVAPNGELQALMSYLGVEHDDGEGELSGGLESLGLGSLGDGGGSYDFGPYEGGLDAYGGSVSEGGLDAYGGNVSEGGLGGTSGSGSELMSEGGVEAA